MRLKGTYQLGDGLDGLSINALGSFPQIRAKEKLAYPRYYLFDFGQIATATIGKDINGNYWNNFSGNASNFNIRTSKNLNTNINVYSAIGYGFAAGSAGGLLNPSGIFLGDLAIPSATRDYYFRASTDGDMGFFIGSLDQSKIYDFGFFSSRDTNVETRITAFQVSGGNIIASGNLTTSGPNIGQGGTYNGNNNTILNIYGIKPNSNSEIFFRTDLVSGGFQYLNAMKITENIDTNLYNLAIGSSIINRWNTISLDLHDPILNVAVEGSTVKQWLPNATENYWNTKIATNQTAPVALVYLGSNDISNGDTAATVYNNTILFLNELLNLNEDLKIIYLSIIRSPSKQAAGKIATVNSVNSQVQSWISNLNSRIYYADINTYLVDINGNPLEAGLFLADGAHLTTLGYTKLTQVLQPLLATVLDANPVDAQGYGLAWMDDFNGTSLNTSYWSATDNYDGANGELQFYTSTTGTTGNLNVSGSKLYLTARSGEYTSQGPFMPAPATTQFTSALVETLNKKEFQYGKIEASIKIPSGLGLWPAFWMLGDNYFTAGFPLCGEIDIMEHANVQPAYTSALHTFNRNHTIPAGGWVQGKQLPSNYHTQFYTYGTEWTSTGISFYLNNTGFFNVTTGQAGTGVQNWPFDQPFWLKLNLAVGGSYGGSPNGGNWTIPQTMEIDWVKVYQK